MPELVPTTVANLRPSSLAAPVGALMRPSLRVDLADSLSLAATRFRQNGASLLPVSDGDRLAGMLSEAALARALGDGVETTDAVRDWIEPAPTILNYESGAEALRRTQAGETLVVVDEQRRVLGLISAADLWPRKRPQLRPPAVGGMATPFGVYLTTGSVSAGAPKWAIMATGACMFGMMLAAALVMELVANYLMSSLKLTDATASTIGVTGTVLLFLLFMRLVPLSGTHGAEHQVVHAIEREVELRPDVVRRMPRVHPRCGTNIAVGAIIFLSIVDLPIWTKLALGELHYLVAAIAAFVFWRPIGSLLQQYVTTKRPSDRQLKGGIRAGKALIDEYAGAKAAFPSPWARIWHSGMLHVIAGALVVASIVGLIQVVFKVSWLPQVF